MNYFKMLIYSWCFGFWSCDECWIKEVEYNVVSNCLIVVMTLWEKYTVLKYTLSSLKIIFNVFELQVVAFFVFFLKMINFSVCEIQAEL